MTLQSPIRLEWISEQEFDVERGTSDLRSLPPVVGCILESLATVDSSIPKF